jgi:hypothetical protein
LTILPDQQKTRANVYAGIYGEGGTGKGQLALRIAHRLVAPAGGLIVVIEADGKRMRPHAKDAAGNGFTWKPIVFDEADPIKLVRALHELADAAEASPVPMAVIVDGMTRFWNDPMGLKWRNLNIHAKKLTRDGKSDLSSWVPTGEEEHTIYRALRRLHAQAHVILCLEQSNVFSGQKAAGIGPDFRKGLAHELGFLFRMERYLGQTTTEHEARVRDVEAAKSAHRAIVEKTPLVTLHAHNDGTVDFEYPMPTGQIFEDPGFEIADLMVAELDGIEDSAEAEAAHFLAHLDGQSRENLLAAYGAVSQGIKGWPKHVVDSTCAAIVEMGLKLADNKPAATPVPAAEVMAGYAWSGLTGASTEEEWGEAAVALMEDADETELAAFEKTAIGYGRFSEEIRRLVAARGEELAADVLPQPVAIEDLTTGSDAGDWEAAIKGCSTKAQWDAIKTRAEHQQMLQKYKPALAKRWEELKTASAESAPKVDTVQA